MFFDKILQRIVRALPPRGVTVELYKCNKCGRWVTMGEIIDTRPLYACPKCNSMRVSAPFTVPGHVALWLWITRRKKLLYGLKEGVHDTYRGRT